VSLTDALAPDGDGHTELSADDCEGLIPSYVTTRGDLFDAEQRNIVAALRHAPPRTARLLDDKYLRELHKSMLGQVWDWAGRYRTRETNIGIDPSDIAGAVRTLVDDTTAWVDMAVYDPDELCARFHHRIVQIHPFPNGNGRHGRIAADYLLVSLGEATFTWGQRLNVGTDDLRRTYRLALKRADGGDISALLTFCRS